MSQYSNFAVKLEDQDMFWASSQGLQAMYENIALLFII